MFHDGPLIPDPLATGGGGRRLALLIDADNVPCTAAEAMIAELSRFGSVDVRRAYGDWTSGNLKGWSRRLHELAIRPIQQFSYTSGKNATDIALVIDAMELLYTRRPAAIGIASSDADFTPLVLQLRAGGLDVHGFGERKTPVPFVNACTRFVHLDAPAAEPPAEEADGTVAAGPPAAPGKALAGNTKLVMALRNAVRLAARKDGWAPLGAAGDLARRASIDPQVFGAKNFTALFTDVGLFEIVPVEGGQRFLADRRNKDRAPQPVA